MRIVALIASMTLAGSILTATTTPAAQATATGCDQSSGQTIAGTSVWGRRIELRRLGDCVWGRITAGHANDTIWIDRSVYGYQVAPWQQLGYTWIDWGSTKFTAPFPALSRYARACGKPFDHAEIGCTNWVYVT